MNEHALAVALAGGRIAGAALDVREAEPPESDDPLLSNSPLPLGGVKASGVGRENGAEGIEAFLETKAASIGV